VSREKRAREDPGAGRKGWGNYGGKKKKAYFAGCGAGKEKRVARGRKKGGR